MNVRAVGIRCRQIWKNDHLKDLIEKQLASNFLKSRESVICYVKLELAKDDETFGKKKKKPVDCQK